jgi:5-methylcytosine-specific restriction endonuclease McrA
LKNQLRNVHQKWWAKNEAERLARVSRGNYQCAMCKSIVKRGNYNMDHIDSVIPLNGMVMRPPDFKRINFDIYIDRLFVLSDKYQLLCILCHNSKTQLENGQRMFYKAERKKK